MNPRYAWLRQHLTAKPSELRELVFEPVRLLVVEVCRIEHEEID